MRPSKSIFCLSRPLLIPREFLVRTVEQVLAYKPLNSEPNSVLYVFTSRPFELLKR